jgi:hypothetical protein
MTTKGTTWGESPRPAHQGPKQSGKRTNKSCRWPWRREQARIEAAGGFVLRNRVLGILAVTRSFGDHQMKDYVIGTPFTSTTR